MRSTLCVALALVLGNPAVSASLQDKKKEQDAVLSRKDTRVEPTSWGDVRGRVYDAVTCAPIPNARVQVETDAGFEEKGRSVDDKTDQLGAYKAQAVLGRISSNVDLGRVLLSSGVGLLFGSGKNTTKRIDVARVDMRISAPGYQTYEGPVVARSQDAGDFRIDMEPVLLVPEGQPGRSLSANGWAAVRIDGAEALPAVAHKGEKVRLRALVRAYGKNPGKNVEVVAFSRLWSGERSMSVSKEPGPNGLIAFETDYKVGDKDRAEPVYFAIKKSELDYSAERSVAAAVVQVAKDGHDAELAASRTEAIDEVRHGKSRDAMGRFKLLAAEPKAPQFDLEMLADTAERAADYDAAASAWQRMVATKGGDEEVELAGYVKALSLAKRYPDVIAAVEPRLKGTKSRDWPKRIAPSAVGRLGMAYVKTGDLDKAAKINEDLLEWPTSGLDASVIEFRSSLRLAQVEQANAAQLNSPAALADYGRALVDLGRYEEAVTKLKASLDADPSQIAVRRDLAWAMLQNQGTPPPAGDLASAVAGVKASLNLDKGKQRSKDFTAWDQYAILLYALAEDQRAAGDPAAASTGGEAIDALREALSLGRVGAKNNAGAFSYTYGYLTGSEVAVSGFAYPQANASFVLLDSLKRLRKSPDDALALFDEAAALFDLGQTTLAQHSLAHLLTIRPDDTEAMFLEALAKAKADDADGAKTRLEAVLKANPRHPRANLVLADLYAKDGDVAGSAERLAAHAQYYGTPAQRP